MAKLPFMQFYPADWIQDTQVLTSTAKGAWIDILCQLWVSDTPGKRTWSRREFTTLLRLAYDEETEQMVADLSRVGDVTLTDSDDNEVETFAECTWITIKSRRIMRDWEALRARKDTHKRYNAKRKHNDRQTTVERQVNDTKTTSIYQKSEVRSQKSELREEKNPPLPPEGDAEFEEFWKVYPRKVGKKAARKAWKKAKGKPPFGEIVASVALQARSEQWTKDNGQFIPNPSTWLNQGRWADEVEVKKPSLMESFLARGKHDGHGSGAVLSRVVDVGLATVGTDLPGPRRTHHG